MKQQDDEILPEELNLDGTEKRGNYRVIGARQDILHALKYHWCAACVVTTLLHWTEHKRDLLRLEVKRRRERNEPPLSPAELEIWIHMSFDEFAMIEFDGLYSHNTVKAEIVMLVEEGFLFQRKNIDPRFKDYEYRLNIPTLRKALKALPVTPKNYAPTKKEPPKLAVSPILAVSPKLVDEPPKLVDEPPKLANDTANFGEPLHILSHTHTFSLSSSETENEIVEFDEQPEPEEEREKNGDELGEDDTPTQEQERVIVFPAPRQEQPPPPDYITAPPAPLPLKCDPEKLRLQFNTWRLVFDAPPGKVHRDALTQGIPTSKKHREGQDETLFSLARLGTFQEICDIRDEMVHHDPKFWSLDGNRHAINEFNILNKWHDMRNQRRDRLAGKSGNGPPRHANGTVSGARRIGG